MTDKRDRLEDLAQDSVQRRGFSGLSFRTLADEAGIKSSSVHYYFPEKSDLARVLIQRYSNSFHENLNAICARNWSLKRKISAFIGLFDEVAKSERVCLCGMMAAEYELLSEQNKTLLAQFFQQTEKNLQDMFETHADELSSALNPAQLAKAMMSSLEGALLLDRVAGNHQRIKAQRELYLSLLS